MKLLIKGGFPSSQPRNHAQTIRSSLTLKTSQLIMLFFTILSFTLPCLAQNSVAADGWVVLPVEEYRALRRAAFPAEEEALPPPVEATLSRIDYDLKVDGDLASGEARLTVDVIKDGWVRLGLPEGLMVREAQVDGRQVTLVRTQNSTADLLISRLGRSVVTLKIVAPVSTVAGTDILKLPVNNSAISHASIELLRQGVDVRINGGLLLEHSDTASGSKWTANGNGSEPLMFAWRRRVDDQKLTQALKFRGSITQLVSLGEDATQVSAEIQVDVVQGVAQDVRLQLPEQFNVNQVAGAMVADWTTSGRQLVVAFIEPVQSTSRFTINGELRLARAGKVDVPLLRIPGAERETGGIAIEVLGAGEIKDRQPRGLTETEAADLGQLISNRQSPSLIAYRLLPASGTSDRALSVDVARYTPQAVLTANIEEASYSALVTEDGKILVQSRFAVRNNQRNFLKLNLPPNAVLWSASVGGRPMRPGRAADGSILLPLEKSRSGDEAPSFVVEISYMDRTTAWAERGHLNLPLVAVDLPISKSHLLLHYSPLFRVAPVVGSTGNFRIAPADFTPSSILVTASPETPKPSTEPAQTDNSSEISQQLLSQLPSTKIGSRPVRNLPLRVPFPHFGPSVVLMAELTSESQTPVAEFDFQRDKKRGAR
jgi:hypothetical protein